MSPQRVLLRYSQVTLVSRYPFWKLSIDHNIEVHVDVEYQVKHRYLRHALAHYKKIIPSHYKKTANQSLRTNCNEAFPSGFTSLSCFKSFLKNLYKSLLMNVFDMDMVCSWSISPKCACHYNWMIYVGICFIFIFLNFRFLHS